MHVSEHFTLHEARCRCGCGIEKKHIPEISALAELHEEFRAALNADPELKQYLGTAKEFGLVVLSWVRCEAHNKAVNGAANNSRHLAKHCEATDLTCPRIPASVLYEKAKPFYETVILYPDKNFIHVDTRAWADGLAHAWVNEPRPVA